MQEHPGFETTSFERFRSYLKGIARAKIGNQVSPDLDASDLVQQTLMDAYRNQTQFRGTTEKELRGWLRGILSLKLIDQFRANRRARRDVSRVRSIEAGPDESHGLDLQAEQTSPSEVAQRNERLELLQTALARLNDSQRKALLLRHCQGKSLSEIALELGKSEAAVAGLLKRGLAELRKTLPDFLEESQM